MRDGATRKTQITAGSRSHRGNSSSAPGNRFILHDHGVPALSASLAPTEVSKKWLQFIRCIFKNMMGVAGTQALWKTWSHLEKPAPISGKSGPHKARIPSPLARRSRLSAPISPPELNPQS